MSTVSWSGKRCHNNQKKTVRAYGHRDYAAEMIPCITEQNTHSTAERKAKTQQLFLLWEQNVEHSGESKQLKGDFSFPISHLREIFRGE